MDSAARARNRRGEGAKLHDDILDAAAQLLEQAGSEEAITLRAVARAVGISAPSIYGHFADREAIVEAVIDRAFADFLAALQDSVSSEKDPVKRLRRGCTAYLDYARDHPSRYRLMFQRSHADAQPADAQPADVEPAGPQATDPAPGTGKDLGDRVAGFTFLVDAVQRCVDAGRSTSTDATRDAVALWVGMHGYSTLHTGLPGFPWPSRTIVLDRLIAGVVPRA